jgi:ATP-binding cassette subfamily B protein
MAAFERALAAWRAGDATAEAESAEDAAQDITAEAAEAPPSTWVLLRLWRFARPYRGQLLLGFLLTLASTGASLVPPYLTIPLMDQVLIPFQSGQRIDPSLVWMLLAGLLVSALVAWALGWARTWLLALVSERIGADLRTATFEHLLRLSLDYFGGKRTGDLMARIGSESDRICVFLSLHALDFATDVLMMLMTAVILFSIEPSLALATLLPLPFIVWMIHLVRDRLRTGFEKIDRVWGEVTSVLADTIPGIRVVKAFAQEKREAERFQRANQANLVVNDRINKVWSLFSPTVTLLTEIGLLVVWAFGIWLVSRDQVTVGVLTAFIAYIGRFYGRLDSMSRIVSLTQKAAAGAKRIFDILDHVSSVPEPAQPVTLPTVQGRLSLRGVHFRYGSRAVIRGVDLDIAAGEMIGLVGHSGSGKSTLVNLICRFHDVSDGAIRLDGVDLRRLRVEDHRRHIGLVLQEPFLFFGTVAENIAYGRPDASREAIVAAARAAHAHDFILRLPHGYDSMLGERGQGLSGGERQRISIARALLIDPRILILDEATSSVDTETEKEIQQALDNLVRGRTTIAIAHRLSTLRRADRLVVMDRGRVVEQGGHEELLASRGAYWRLHEAQARQAREAMAVAGLELPMPGVALPLPEPVSLPAGLPMQPASLAVVGESATPQTLSPGVQVEAAVPQATSAGLQATPAMPQPLDIAVDRIELSCDAHGRLLLHVDGRDAADVHPVRAFPLSDPHGAIALVGSDGREALWIDTMHALAPATAQHINDALAARQIEPRILRIDAVSTFATPSTWQVDTDRGAAELVLKAEEDIRRLPDGRLLVQDAQGLVFHIEEPRSLDRRSRRLLERFL